jgi:hypothetical protein
VSPEFVTPPELAKVYRVKPESILAAIRRGELKAIDMARPGSRRPRFRISRQAIADFEQLRSTGGRAAHSTRAARKKAPAGMREYY